MTGPGPGGGSTPAPRGAGDPAGSRRRRLSARRLLAAVLVAGLAWGIAGPAAGGVDELVPAAERVAVERLALGDGRFAITALRAGPPRGNGYLLIDRDRQRLLVIDPCATPSVVLTAAAIEEATVEAVVLTAPGPGPDARALAALASCPLVVPAAPSAAADAPDAAGDTFAPPGLLAVGGWRLLPLPLPAGSAQGVALLFDPRLHRASFADADVGTEREYVLFTGLGLFADRLGEAADFGRDQRLRRAVVRHVLPLPDTTLVLPGRGWGTVLGQMRPWLVRDLPVPPER